MSKNRFHYLLFVFISFFFTNLSAQTARFLNLSRSSEMYFEKAINQVGNHFHSSIKPYSFNDLNKIKNADSLIDNSGKLAQLFQAKSNKKDAAKKNYLKISLSPLLDTGIGFEKNTHRSHGLINGGLGFNIRSFITKKIHISLNYMYDNSRYTDYVSKSIINTRTIPGLGFAHPTKLGYRRQEFSGTITYTPSETFTFQLGQGKNFLGDGYRSLLLSDYANNYSYFKIITTIWKIKYVNIFTNFKDLNNLSNNSYFNFDNKYGTFHYLSWEATKRLNISLFETVIWQGKDTLNNRDFDVNYLNPIIFYRPVEYSTGSADNSILGLNISYKANNNFKLYGQLVLDEFLLREIKADIRQAFSPSQNIQSGWWANKYGVQLGFKWFNVFGVKNLIWQNEYNLVRPFTYSHINSLTSYGHYNQPLAHPFGANFHELVSIFNYWKKNWQFQLKSIYAIRGLNKNGNNYGQNIFESYNTRLKTYENYIGQGLSTTFLSNELKVGYLLDGTTGLKIELGLGNRIFNNSNANTTTSYFMFSIKSDFRNVYRDF